MAGQGKFKIEVLSTGDEGEGDDVVDTGAAAQDEGDVKDDGELDGASGAGEGDTDDTVTDEPVLTIGEERLSGDDAGDDDQGKQAPRWVRELRTTNRALVKRNRELEERIAAVAPESDAPKRIEVGPKPRIEDFDYDTGKFEAAFEDWTKRKLAHEDQLRAERNAREDQDKAWKAKLGERAKQKSELGFRDFDDVEAAVEAALSVTQRGIIIQGADKPALLEYALGKNPARLKEMAAISDPVKFAFAVAKLETQLKLETRRKAPAPESRVARSGNVSMAANRSSDAVLERLRAEAAKSGDFTQVRAYKQKLKTNRSG